MSLLESLALLKSDDNWNTNDRHLLFGPSSVLARAVQQACHHNGNSDVLKVLAEIVSQHRAEEFGPRVLGKLSRDSSRRDFEVRERLMVLENLDRICDALLGGSIADSQSNVKDDANTRIAAPGTREAEIEKWLRAIASHHQQEPVCLPILTIIDGQKLLPGATVVPSAAATTPVLEAAVAELRVTRFESQTLEFVQRPGCLGLTVLSRGEHNQRNEPTGFADGLDNAWTLFFKAQQTTSDPVGGYCWSIARHAEEEEHALALLRLHDRSLEAAFLCALWAAAGGVPGHDGIGNDHLDEFGTVTATLGTLEEGADDPGQIPLHRVSGLARKAVAAFSRGLTLIVVASEQWPSDQDEVDEAFEAAGVEDWQDKLQICPVETAGEAFDELIRSSRYTRFYQESVRASFVADYYEIDDDGNRIAPEEDDAPAESADANSEEESSVDGS